MIFWIAITGLLILAVVIVLVPLWRHSGERDASSREQQNIAIAREQKSLMEKQLAAGDITQTEFDAREVDLQNALAIDLERDEATLGTSQGKWMIWILIVMLPIASLLLYFEFGTYRVIEDPRLADIAPPRQPQQAPAMSMEEMIAVVKQRLRDNPDDAQGWFVLGKTMMAQQDFAAAVTAFHRANEIAQNQPGILFSLADALAMQNNGDLMGEPAALVTRGLAMAPQDPTGLWLAGLVAEQTQDYQAAFQYWTRLLPLISNDAASTLEIEGLLAALKERDPAIQQLEQAGVRQLTVSVDLAAGLRDRVQPGDSLFIYAKAMSGPPMPLAVKRLTAADLPVTVSLSDVDAMLPNMKLSSFEQVIVGARVSKSGNPIAQSGDLYVEKSAIDSKNPPDGLALTIDQIKQ